ncbi:MAG: LCP family protein [Spirochaetes bacterium]|nr:LCP family protein [Spirochaetota bacterium]
MNQKELFHIFRLLCMLVVIFFTLFIISVNVFKYLNFLFEVNRVIDVAVTTEKEEINIIRSHFTEEDTSIIHQYDQTIAHNAFEMGYINQISELNNTEWGDGINILLIGSDKENFLEKKSRADVIIVLRINQQGKILALSIPRDTLITIDFPCAWENQQDKIGHSLYWGGIEGLKTSIQSIIHAPIHKTVVIDNFRTYEAFLAIIGGLSTDKYLVGQKGVQWIRNRQFKFGDIERCRRHQVFLKKAFIKVWAITKGGSIIYTALLYKYFAKLLETDIAKNDFYDILYHLKINQFDPSQDFYTSVLEGDFGVYQSNIIKNEELSCWLIDKKKVEIIQFLFYSNQTSYTEFFDYRNIKMSEILIWEFKNLFHKGKNQINKDLKNTKDILVQN